MVDASGEYIHTVAHTKPPGVTEGEASMRETARSCANGRVCSKESTGRAHAASPSLSVRPSERTSTRAGAPGCTSASAFASAPGRSDPSRPIVWMKPSKPVLEGCCSTAEPRPNETTARSAAAGRLDASERMIFSCSFRASSPIESDLSAATTSVPHRSLLGNTGRAIASTARAAATSAAFLLYR